MGRAARALPFLAAGLLAAVPAPAQTMIALGETVSLDFAGLDRGRPYPVPGADAVYLHVSVSERRITALRGGVVLHSFPVGVGKGGSLRGADGTVWEWDTPTGIFEVGRKRKDPVWYRPDWYYVEKGRPVPPADSPARYARGMLMRNEDIAVLYDLVDVGTEVIVTP